MLWQATGAPLPSGGWGQARSSDSQPKPALPTGCRGRARRSGTWPVLPAHWGPALLWHAAGAPLPNGGPGSHASLWRGRSLPCPPGGRDRACCPGSPPEFPLPTEGRDRACCPGSPPKFPLPTGGRGHARLISNVNQNSLWLMFDINH